MSIGLFVMVEEVVLSMAEESKLQPKTKITNTNIEEAFDALATFLFEQYKKKQQAEAIVEPQDSVST
jgi:hypothetical protein